MLVGAMNTIQVRAVPGRSGALGSRLEYIVGVLDKVSGCLSYSLSCSDADEDVWIVSGCWESKAAMEAHFLDPWMDALMDLAYCDVAISLRFNTSIFSPVSSR
ncbi:MAG: antibiotic biosynthesis monooxygenase [Pseudomonas sp.]|nr:antibiotic biosynthesis monooxygenase [Pseudomonas sp.]